MDEQNNFYNNNNENNDSVNNNNNENTYGSNSYSGYDFSKANSYKADGYSADDANADSYNSGSYKADGYNADNYKADRSYIDEKPKKRKEKKEKQPGGNKVGRFFGKLAASAAIGVFFGGAAAGSFYAVNTYVIKDNSTAVQTDADVEKLQETVTSIQNALATGTNGVTAISTSVSSDVTGVVDKVMPSMVAVNNTGVTVTTDWFGRSYESESSSCGSGIIVGESDTEYFIATNHHVIDGAKTLTVVFADEAEVEAYVKGYDSSMDIAVIAVLKEKMSSETFSAIAVAELGDSDSLKIGEPSIAIGNALGYGQSVTTGVVSALDRDMTIDGTTYENLIQTSAAINPGNSGGALLNIAGQVIGINSSKVGGNTVEGMGFAIPINEVKDIISEFSLREVRTKVDDAERGYLGISSSDQYDLTAFGYPAGVYIQKVYDNSPAKTAGLYMGDIITKVDGQSVKSISELSEFLSYYKAGETVKLSVTRNVQGELKELEIEVTLGDKSAIN